MQPWGHVALAYLSYAGVIHWRDDDPPTGPQTAAVAVAALLPDAVDKPLAWTFSLVPVGRTVSHSLVVLLPFAFFVYWVSRRRGRPAVGDAVVVGVLTHALGDALHTVFAEPYGEAPRFLLWPLLSGPAASDAGFHLLWNPTVGPFFWFQAGLTAVAAGAWYRHGTPGLGGLRRRIGH